MKGWFGKRYGFRIENEWILPTTGVIPALSVILKALTEPGDKVILQTPVYNCFFAVLERTGRQPLANPLINENGAYRMDLEDLERKAADPQAKLIFLCNPHNPAGRAWTAEELTRLGEICLRHGVTVISDEIHCDLTLDGHRHIPFASLNEEFLRHSVTCTAPSKTFNIAGLQAKYFVSDCWDINFSLGMNISITPKKDYLEGDYESVPDIIIPAQKYVNAQVTNNWYVSVGSNRYFKTSNPRIHPYIGAVAGFQMARIETTEPYTGKTYSDGEDEDSEEGLPEHVYLAAGKARS